MQSTVLVLLALLAVALAMRQQAIAVKGRLVCGAKPANNVRIKLWEEDSGPDPDDLLDQGYTDANGEFLLKGDTRELTNIDPVFKVYHDCDDGIMPGKRKVKFALPYSYVTAGKEPKKVFDIGVLNLETIFKKEEREMIPGKRKVKFALPYSYVTAGKEPKKVFDIGVLNLETIFKKEEREMIVSKKRRSPRHHHRHISAELAEESDFEY
uniref:Transthyretin-like family protein n=1 Tax=Steinernema glaseri TaxID=37863 RepID=A0A1I7ZBU1_9BILA